jgi:uncharacterized protein (DUF58 family)
MGLSQWFRMGRESLRRSLDIEGQAAGWIEIGWRRLYILPTRAGWVLIAANLFLLVGSMNFDSALGFILSFMLAGMLLSALYLANRNLLGLRLQALGAESVCVGQTMALEFKLHNAAGIGRHEVRVSRGSSRSQAIDLPPGAQGGVSLPVPALRRGRVDEYSIRLESRYPAGLFRSFVRLRMRGSLHVWPEPKGEVSVLRAELLAEVVEPAGRPDRTAVQEDDFQGLREFRRGDSPRHVAWRRFAHDGELSVKAFAGEVPEVLWLDWSRLPVADSEERLSLLCGAALELGQRGLSFGLSLPGQRIQPGAGQRHRVQVLHVLSEYGDAVGAIG